MDTRNNKENRYHFRDIDSRVSGRKGCELCQQKFLWKYSTCPGKDSPPSLSPENINSLSPSHYKQEEDLLGFGQQVCAAGAEGGPGASSRESEDPGTIQLWLLVLNS